MVQTAKWSVIVLLVSTGLCAQYRPQNLKWVATAVTPIPPTSIITAMWYDANQEKITRNSILAVCARAQLILGEIKKPTISGRMPVMAAWCCRRSYAAGAVDCPIPSNFPVIPVISYLTLSLFYFSIEIVFV